MNKYEILEGKLTAINAYIDTMCLNSNGAVMGLIRGVSDYDELCADDTFWQLVTEADNYYCNECQSF